MISGAEACSEGIAELAMIYQGAYTAFRAATACSKRGQSIIHAHCISPAAEAAQPAYLTGRVAAHARLNMLDQCFILLQSVIYQQIVLVSPWPVTFSAKK